MQHSYTVLLHHFLRLLGKKISLSSSSSSLPPVFCIVNTLLLAPLPVVFPLSIPSPWGYPVLAGEAGGGKETEVKDGREVQGEERRKRGGRERGESKMWQTKVRAESRGGRQGWEERAGAGAVEGTCKPLLAHSYLDRHWNTSRTELLHLLYMLVSQILTFSHEGWRHSLCSVLWAASSLWRGSRRLDLSMAGSTRSHRGVQHGKGFFPLLHDVKANL